MNAIRTVEDFNFAGHTAIVRVDFNVPLDKVTRLVKDDTRIRAAVATIKKILDDGGKVILMSHLGRPKGKRDETFSLQLILKPLEEIMGQKIFFVSDCIGSEVAAAAAALKPKEILLLENLRFHPEEEKGDENFSRQLASLADVYVNDAFGTAHRAHASTAVMAKFFSTEKKMFGFLMAAEIKNADLATSNPARPFTAIIGGAKVSDKILILERLIDLANTIIVGGGMAYTFFRAMGGNTGNSLCEEDKLELALSLLKKAETKGVEFLLPADSVTATSFSNDSHSGICPSMSITSGSMALDIGPKAIQEFSEAIGKSKTVLWNGPMGVFEFSNFQEGTRQIALAVARVTKQNGAFTLIGGGDSVAAINKFGLNHEVSYVSTGGGAMLEYFEGKKLPGIAAIQE
jgi:phosphoglycerate kinase